MKIDNRRYQSSDLFLSKITASIFPKMSPLDSTGFRLRRVTAALRPRYGRVTAALRLRGSVHSDRGHSSQWVLFHQTCRVTARSVPEASQKHLGAGPRQK